MRILTDGWKVIRREKGILGSVTPYELTVLLQKAEDAGASNLQISRIREALLGEKGLKFKLGDGGCGFNQLQDHVDQHPLLRHAFLGNHTGSLTDFLLAEVEAEQRIRTER